LKEKESIERGVDYLSLELPFGLLIIIFFALATMALSNCRVEAWLKISIRRI
jgi:hypothetical protein